MPRAVITGAAGGIGGVCAAELGSSGWSVTGLDLRAGNDPAIDWVEVDVRDRNGLGAVSANLGPVDLLVNAAGTADAAPAADMSADQWSAVLDVCLTGTFNACQALHPNLELGGGTVVNIASAAARTAFSNHANYCVAKVGVEMLTKVLAIEWAPEIRVVGISPGYVGTPLFRRGNPGGVGEGDVPHRLYPGCTDRQAGRDRRDHPRSRVEGIRLRHRHHTRCRWRLHRERWGGTGECCEAGAGQLVAGRPHLELGRNRDEDRGPRPVEAHRRMTVAGEVFGEDYVAGPHSPAGAVAHGQLNRPFESDDQLAPRRVVRGPICRPSGECRTQVPSGAIGSDARPSRCSRSGTSMSPKNERPSASAPMRVILTLPPCFSLVAVVVLSLPARQQGFR